MAGGTLIVSREINNQTFYKKRFEEIGFPNVTVTAKDKDALYFQIRDLKPDQLIMGARFYHCCTPFVMGELHQTFPKIKMLAVCLGEYPDAIAMYFILNGINSYITSFDGFDQFYQGLGEVAKGREWVSPGVVKQIDLRREYPDPAGIITERLLQVARLICCGFKERQIAELLSISRCTVARHRVEIYTTLNVNSSIELLRAALTLEMVRLEELYFYPRDLSVNPQPDKTFKRKTNSRRNYVN
jgi:DNA-binding NarL/FixJ family response regulator